MDANLPPTFYQTLNEAKSLGTRHLLQVYRKLALRYHPDKSSGGHEVMSALSKAYREVIATNTQNHSLGGTGNSTNGALSCEMCGESIEVTEQDLEAGCSEFECTSCGYVLYFDQ